MSPKSTPPNKTRTTSNAFGRQSSAATKTPAANVFNASATPPPPAAAARPAPLHAVPAEPTQVSEGTSGAEAALTAPVHPERRAPESGIRNTADRSSPLDPVDALAERELRTAQDQVEDLIEEVVRVAQLDEEDRKAIPGLVERLANVSRNSDDTLKKLLEKVNEIPSAGKAQIPLEIAPHLHQKLKAEASANRRKGPGTASTMTTLVLVAIGEAHESGRLKQLAQKHKTGERHKVPLFGNIAIGKTPRGQTMRLQFAPPTTAKTMADILAAWHRVGFVVLVRLAVEDYFDRRSRKATRDSGAAVDETMEG